MNYQQSSKEELIKFANDRGVQIKSTARSNRGPLKIEYMRALLHADKSPVFDFMGLAPELRLLIYEYLLTLLPSGPWRRRESCWPAILLSCKAVNSEATKLLYNNTVKSNMISRRLWPNMSYIDCNFSYHLWPSFCPPFFRRIHHLSMHLCSFDNFLNMQNRLYMLCCLLHGNHTLQSLHLDFTRSEEIEPHLDFRILPDPSSVYYPLRLLGAGVKITVEGVGDAAHAAHAAKVTQDAGRKPIMWKQVGPVFRDASPWISGQRAEQSAGRHIDETNIAHAVEIVQWLEGRHLFDKEWERTLESHYMDLVRMGVHRFAQVFDSRALEFPEDDSEDESEDESEWRTMIRASPTAASSR